MLSRLWHLIKQLFKLEKTSTSSKQQQENQNYDDGYTNTSNINFTAIFANKLATSAVSDSTVIIEEDNKRCELLKAALDDVWDKIKKIIASALGTGGCIIVPYVKDGQIYYNTIKQNRLLINERIGERITRATVLADSVTINNMVYYRFVNYAVEGNTLYITNKASTKYGAPAVVEQWKDIPDIAIHNVDRVLFGYIKSPIDNRKNADEYGVPVTYGCDKIVADIMDCLDEIRKEFRLKDVRLQVDERAFKKDPKTGKPILPDDDLFIAGHSEDGNMFNIFDPAFRESSYHARLDKLFELFEKQVGTSRGILSTPATHGATATEIRAANQDTFALVSAIREEVEKGLRDYIYACDVLANFYHLSPQGEYNLSFDWSYAMIESTTEEWQQMKDLQSIGGLSKAELRAWKTGESPEDAQKAIDEIAAREPNLTTLMGMSE